MLAGIERSRRAAGHRAHRGAGGAHPQVHQERVPPLRQRQGGTQGDVPRRATSCSRRASSVRVVTLPEGEDPGHLRRASTARAGFETQLARVDRRVRAEDPDPRARRLVRRPAPEARRRSTSCCRRFARRAIRSRATSTSRARSEVAGRVARDARARAATRAPAVERRGAARDRRSAAEPPIDGAGRRAVRGRAPTPITGRDGRPAPSASSCGCCCISAGTSRPRRSESAPDIFAIRLSRRSSRS